MSEKEKINEVKFENIDNNKINKTNIKENENLQKEKNQEQNFLSFNSKIGTNENDDNNFKTFDFNINPFNEKKTKEFADEESNKNSEEDEEFILAEDDIKNNFNLENFNYTNYLNIENNNQTQTINNSNNESQNISNNNYNNNPNKTIPRVPSNPIPSSYINNIRSNQLFSFYQNPISNSLNGNNFLKGFNFPNNSFTMNGRSGWICSNCKNFNYEMRVQCNRCGRTPGQIIFNSNNSSTGNLHSNNLYLNNQIFKNNFNYNHSYSPKKKDDSDKKKKKPFVEREGDWICVQCKNLNFAFRNNCNRCGLTKNENQKFIEKFINNDD